MLANLIHLKKTLRVCTKTNLHNEMRRLHLGTGRQMVEQELVALRQPQIDAAQRVIVERADAHQAQLRVVNVEHLHESETRAHAND